MQFEIHFASTFGPFSEFVIPLTLSLSHSLSFDCGCVCFSHRAFFFLYLSRCFFFASSTFTSDFPCFMFHACMLLDQCAGVASTIDYYKLKMSLVFTQIHYFISTITRTHTHKHSHTHISKSYHILYAQPHCVYAAKRASQTEYLHTTLMAISIVKYCVHLFHLIVNI